MERSGNWVHRLADSGCDPPTAQLSRVTVDETAVKMNGKWSWLCAAIDIETTLVLDVALFHRHGTNPAAAFLYRLEEKRNLSDGTFLVDQFGYLTALARLGLSIRVKYTDRSLIEKWLQTLKTRIDRFHNSWVHSRLSVCEWLEKFMLYYERQRPYQVPDRKTPVEEVLK